jgi:hypothetical protein
MLGPRLRLPCRGTGALNRLSKHARRLLLWGAYLGFACRIAVPVGYMPAPLSEGGPFVICGGGFAGQFFREVARAQLERQHRGSSIPEPAGSGDDDRTVSGGWKYCHVGMHLGASALMSAFVLPIPELDAERPVVAVERPVMAARARRYNARDPPFSLPI